MNLLHLRSRCAPESSFRFRHLHRLLANDLRRQGTKLSAILLTHRNNREGVLAATLLLVRHGAHGDLGNRLTGRGPEDGLSPEGQRQVEALGRELAAAGLRAIYSSPRLRTRQTAQAVAQRAGLGVEIQPALDEIDFGIWTGVSFAELEGQPEWIRWNERRSLARCPDGESMTEAQARAVSFVESAAASHDGQAVALVTHCDIIRALLCWHEQRSLDTILAREVEPASVTKLAVASARRAAA